MATTSGLPEIPKAKHSLVEAPSSQHTQGLLEDSGLELRGSSLLEAMSRPSTASSISRGGGWVGAKSPPGSARFVPSPPPAAHGGAARPRSTLRKSLEYVRISKSELERKDEEINSFRATLGDLQSQLRAVHSCQQDFSKLRDGCGRVASALGCFVEGVAVDAVEGILLTTIHSIKQDHQHTSSKYAQCSKELEECRGELAAGKVSHASTEDSLKKAKRDVKRLDSDLKQTKGELEVMKESCARAGASLECLRQQLAETQGEVGKSEREATRQLTQLQAEVGRLGKEMAAKEEQSRDLQEQLQATEKEREELRARLADSEAMQMEMYVQLASTLQLDPNTSFELDQLLSQVAGVMEECQELRLHCETLASSVKTAELDCKAGRETILRLVAEGKKQERGREEVRRLQGEVERLEEEVESQRASLTTAEQERVGMQERLTAAKETMLALQKQLNAKEEKLAELSKSLDASQFASDTEKSLVTSIQSKYNELVKSLGRALTTSSSDTTTLIAALEKLKLDCSEQSERLVEQESQLSSHAASLQSLREASLGTEQELERERGKVGRLEGEVAALEGASERMERDLEKCRVFSQKVAKAVQLERGTAQVLASSTDFAHDAILMKAEQLAKLESEALLSKQTAVYSLQRKLKTCKQSMLSKELQLSLLQKKVEVLERNSKSSTHVERELEETGTKMRKMEKQVERLQEKVGKQKNSILQLQANNTKLLRTKEVCAELEKQRSKWEGSKEEIEGKCERLSQQLAEARQRDKQRRDTQGKETEKLRAELETLHSEFERVQEREQKLGVFKTAVQRLILSYQECESQEEKLEPPSDYDLIASLEHLIGLVSRQRANTKCLEASLRQLETGFKNSYRDTLTLLSANTDTSS